MEITIRAEAEEIAALVLAVQGRQEMISISDLFNKDAGSQESVGGNPNATI